MVCWPGGYMWSTDGHAGQRTYRQPLSSSLRVSLAPDELRSVTDFIPVVGYASDLQDLAAYHNMMSFVTHFERVAFQVNAAWGWLMFATNTVLTGSILGRIMSVHPVLHADFSLTLLDRYVTRKAKRENAVRTRTTQYSTLMEAVIESALVTWIGLLLYGIATVAPEGHITVRTCHLHLCIVSSHSTP